MHNPEQSIKEGYEVTDMNVRVITYFLIGLFAMMFGAAAAIVMVMRGFEQSRPALNQEPLSALATEGMQIPDEPRLQQDPVADRVAIETANYGQVSSYGRISSEAGMERVHIPIEKAMARVAAGDAPYRQTPKTVQEPTAAQ
jgi:hypothetical protein